MLPGQTTIHEFPYFTGTYADLHAHVVALPMTVLVIALCFSLTQNARDLQIAVQRPRAFPRRTFAVIATAGLLAFTLGSLFVTNAWDVPTYAAVTGVSMLLATRGIRSFVARLGVAAGLTLGIGLVAYLLVLPFSQHYVALYGEIAETRSVTPLAAIEAHFGVFFLIALFGLSFLLARLWTDPPAVCRPAVLVTALTAVLFLRWYAVGQSSRWIEIADGLIVLVAVGWLFLAIMLTIRGRLDFRIAAWIAKAVLIIGWFVVLGGLAAEKPAFGFFFGFGIAASMFWLMLCPAPERFVAMLIAVGMFVGAGVELVYLVDGLSGGDAYRMNTVFKFYNGIWVMLALAAAALVAWMVHGLSESGIFAKDDGTVGSTKAATPDDGSTVTQSGTNPCEPVDDASPAAAPEPDFHRAAPVLSRSWSQVGLVVAGFAILASLAYPVFATGSRLSQHFAQPGASWTLNALDWMDYGIINEHGSGGVRFAYDEDRDVIEWFNSEVGGSPVIAEASIGEYRLGGSRIAIHTGLPVVVGWVWHEVQQRDWTDLLERQEDLRTLYTSIDPDEKRSILDQYRIEYVVVGELERRYPASGFQSTNNSAGIAAFEPLVGTILEVAFVSGETIVYRVIQP